MLGNAATPGYIGPQTCLSCPKIILKNVGNWSVDYSEPVAASFRRILLEKGTSSKKAGNCHTGHLQHLFMSTLF